MNTGADKSIKNEAVSLFTQTGLSKKEIAKKLGYSPHTIAKWINENMQTGKTQGGAMHLKKSKAEKLYINQGKTAKEISSIIGVSEQSIGKWVRSGEWKSEKLKSRGDYRPIWNVQDYHGKHTLIDADMLKDHAKSLFPGEFDSISKIIKDFIDSHQ
ncbi:helix-turn-helix domain-containing protein [Pedobacter antarcticus]|uniref:helix-turn-helix domain-containing protein n=1 Tax=Pedobacter antarcticus TaxID=34086 RepID=UPI00292E1283|nr:helix-turn-helix domain-containing protein [Pedobacter antarcticus]